MSRIPSDLETLTEFSSSRVFQFWRYVVSHRQLLLRSNQTPELPTRLELLFKNVSAMKVPTHLNAVTIHQLPDDREASGTEPVDIEPGQRIFSVTGNNYSGYVVAGALFAHEDQEDYAAPSALLVEGL